MAHTCESVSYPSSPFSYLMKAAIYTEYGPPEVVRLSTTEQPIPKDDEILIRVHASTVNRTDCGFRSAEYVISRLFSGLFKPKHPILGCEFAGEVIQLGSSVTTFAVGDRVFGYDDFRFGGHSEFKTIRSDGPVATIPKGMHYEVAAALTEGSHYALGNIRAANIKEGDYTMVYGATGAIGSAAVQLLKHFGAYVVAVCDTSRTELVRSLGADEVIDYTRRDFIDTEHRYDLVFDAVGKQSFSQCKPILKPEGIYISTELGNRWENIFLALITPLGRGKRVLFPIPTISQKDVGWLGKLAAAGKFVPVIDRHYSFDDIVDAYRYVETGQKTGNVIIRISS